MIQSQAWIHFMNSITHKLFIALSGLIYSNGHLQQRSSFAITNQLDIRHIMAHDNLFEPLDMGTQTLKNRIIMAPLTRLRSVEPGDVPTALASEYYSQRSGAGLVITEATQVSFQAKGYAGAPGIHTQDQITAWKPSLIMSCQRRKIVAKYGYRSGSHESVQLMQTPFCSMSFGSDPWAYTISIR